MAQHNDKATKKDLVLYRIDTAKSDCRASQLLLDAKEFRGQITEPIMQFIMPFLPFML